MDVILCDDACVTANAGYRKRIIAHKLYFSTRNGIGKKEEASFTFCEYV